MNIDKFRNEDGISYTDESGCYHESAKDYYMHEVFKFCGCGCPEDALDYIYKCLKLLTLGNDWINNKESHCDYWKRYRAECDKVFNSEGAEYFMWYWLDNMELTEHGGSVPGWLTEKGKEVLSDLEEILKASPEELEEASEQQPTNAE